jgi:hypothetical protein
MGELKAALIVAAAACDTAEVRRLLEEIELADNAARRLHVVK